MQTLNEAENGKSEAHHDGPLYSGFFEEPYRLQMKIDIVIDVDNDSGLASPVWDDESDKDSGQIPASSPVPLQMFLDSQNGKIAATVEGNIRFKLWFLRSEVSASSKRFKDNLFEVPMEHDTMVCPKSLVSNQICVRIEHVNKQRIFDGLLDDAIVAPPDHYQATKMRKNVDDFPHIFGGKVYQSSYRIVQSLIDG